MDNDRAARFDSSKARTRVNRLGLSIALGYWFVVIAAFLSLQSSGGDMIGTGAIPIAALTLPWSILLIMIHPSWHPDPTRPYYDPLVSTLGTFVLLPLICGGVNAVLVYALIAWSARKRQDRR